MSMCSKYEAPASSWETVNLALTKGNKVWLPTFLKRKKHHVVVLWAFMCHFLAARAEFARKPAVLVLSLAPLTLGKH